MNKPAVSVAKMQRMKRALEREGLPFAGFRTFPDGSVAALVGEPATLTPNDQPALPSPDSDLDAELEQWATKHGYG